MGTLTLTDPVQGTVTDANIVASNNAAIKAVVNGGIDNTNIANAASIAYSKLVLTGSVVNADIANAAAIAASKLAGYPADATKVLKGDGSWGVGALVPSAFAPMFSPTGVTNFAANSAVYSRIFVPGSFAVTKVNIFIGTVSGNIDVGIYADNAGAPGARLWSRGGVACPAGGQQSILISAGTPNVLTLAGGTYWIGWASDNAVVTVSTGVVGANTFPAGLAFQQAAAYPLPANAAGASYPQGVFMVLV